MQKSIWLFGGIAGALCAFVEYLYFSNPVADKSQIFITMMLKILILFVCIIFGLIMIKKIQGGTISIGRTMLSGGLIAVVRALVMMFVFTYLYSPNGEFYENRKSETIAIAKTKIDNDEEIKAEEKEFQFREAKLQIESQFEPMGYAKIVLGASLISGLIMSILVAAVISTNQMTKPE